MSYKNNSKSIVAHPAKREASAVCQFSKKVSLLVRTIQSRTRRLFIKQLQSLIHIVWECKYHIVCIPKYRKNVLYGKICEYLVRALHELPTAEAVRYWKAVYEWITYICCFRFHLNMQWLK